MEACARACRVPPAVEERFSGRVWDCWGRAWSFAALPAVSEDRNLPLLRRLSFAALPAVFCRGLERACVCRLSDVAVFLRPCGREPNFRENLPGDAVGQLPGEDFCERPGRLSGKTVEAAGRVRTGNDSASGRIRAASGAAFACRGRDIVLRVQNHSSQDRSCVQEA